MRARLAAEAKLPPYIICTDVTIAELASERPRTLEALHGITGLGNSKISRYGASFLEVIGAEKPGAAAVIDPRLSASVNATLALFKQGLDAEEISARRSIEISTVYGHFAEAIEAGHLEARQVLLIDEDEIDEILAAFEDLGTLESGKLGPAHAALDGRFNYGILKCLLAELA